MKSRIIDDLMWRYATKKFDPGRKVSETDLEELMEVLRLSPSSFGLQPWKFLIITDKQTREKLKEAAWGQPQVTDASHLIVLCARTDIDEHHIKRFVAELAKARNLSDDAMKDYESIMVGTRKGMSDEAALDWSKRQVYIALGLLLSACAQKRIDACPMEGFDSNKFNEILDLDKHNLTSVVLCPIGYRSENDDTSSAKKVRFEKEDIFILK